MGLHNKVLLSETYFGFYNDRSIRLIGGDERMMIQNEKEIIQLIKEDEWMMDILRAVKSLHLPDWWVCAGFVRSKI